MTIYAVKISGQWWIATKAKAADYSVEPRDIDVWCGAQTTALLGDVGEEEQAMALEPQMDWATNDQLTRRIHQLDRALEKCMIGGNHVALLIGADHPPMTATHDEALTHYGAGDQYEAWCCWKAIMDARTIRDAPTV